MTRTSAWAVGVRPPAQAPLLNTTQGDGAPFAVSVTAVLHLGKPVWLIIDSASFEKVRRTLLPSRGAVWMSPQAEYPPIETKVVASIAFPALRVPFVMPRISLIGTSDELTVALKPGDTVTDHELSRGVAVIASFVTHCDCRKQRFELSLQSRSVTQKTQLPR